MGAGLSAARPTPLAGAGRKKLGGWGAGPRPPPPPLLQSQSQPGTCRVVCFSPRHDLSLAEMECGDIRLIIDLWADQVSELGQDYGWVQVFENKGEIMGCSNPHPHGQIWASKHLPNQARREDQQHRHYPGAQRTRLLPDHAQRE